MANAVPMLAGVGLLSVCCLSSSFMAGAMGGEKTTEETASDSVDESFTVPTDEASLNECYGARYVDLRAAFGTDGASLKNHYTTYTTNGSENRNNSCTLSDEEAQCYLDRYEDVKTFAGTNLELARKHYYETGISENRDFACPPAIKELECYGDRYSDLQSAFGTDYDARGTDKTLYRLNQHWHNHGKSENRDFSC